LGNPTSSLKKYMSRLTSAQFADIPLEDGVDVVDPYLREVQVENGGGALHQLPEPQQQDLVGE
jgi:hypothetical protein